MLYFYSISIPTTRLNGKACFLLLLMILLTFSDAWGQKKFKLSKALREAKEAVRIEEYAYAIDVLKQISREAPEEPEHKYLLGKAYLGLNKVDSALIFFRSMEGVAEGQEDSYYHMGSIFHKRHQFDSARYFYKKYRVSETFGEGEQSMVDRYIKQCEIGLSMLKDQKEVQIENLGEGINTEYAEFAPVVSADETRLIFTSRRPGNVGGYDEFRGGYYEDIYIVEKDENGKWGKPRNIGDHINTPTHDASIGLSPDGNELYIYRANETQMRLSGDIYYSDYEDGEWSKPIKMQEGINSKYWEPHASITANEEFLFFTSNRDDETGKGGSDIYMVRRLPDLSWAKPVNLEVVNTPYDEDSPFIHPDGRTLYFSSNGGNSMGGFDIFMSHYNEETGEWSAPENMGYPINTAGDDIFVVWSVDGERGYFSSQREDSFGETDLYMMTFPERRVNPILIKGVVSDADTGKPLASVIEVVNNKTQHIVNVATTDSRTGKYTIVLPPNKNYGIRYMSNGYLFKSVNINVPEQFEYLEIHEDVELKPIEVNQHEVLNNVFFGEDLGLRYESDAEIKDLKEFLGGLDEDYYIEIMVHSDNMEDSLLSVFKTQAKADAIALKANTLEGDPRKMLPKGVGPRFPAYTNTTERGRQLNSRIEYILRSKSAEEEEEEREVKEQEFTAIRNAGQELKVGDEILVSPKIYFKTNSSIIQDSSFYIVEQLAAFLLEKPELKIEIAGHTDNQGSHAYNLSLGQRRASVVRQQLVYRGIAPERLIARSYGESKPIATNDTKEGRSKNRRTAFIVIGLNEDVKMRAPVAPSDKD